ncbi:hypothetical protein SDC9_103215 [bioreactor metagenome]|uniref:Porphobilinogen deaminase C-terminal domain-containing protein n=2 Tax=root TaxID=1 RepID=A0A645AT18_9ZZZZ
MGAYCEVDGEKIKLTGLYGDEEGKVLVIKSMEGNVQSPRELGIELAKLILKEYDSHER